MNPELTNEQQQALVENQGFVQGQSYVLMSIDMFRNTMGVGSDEELASSIAALQKSMAEARDGKTRLFTDALDDLGLKYEVPS